MRERLPHFLPWTAIGGDIDDVDGGYLACDLIESDAEFIVLACNNHAALLDALKECVEAGDAVVPFVEHHAEQVEEGHSCSSPNAHCDMTCVGAAYDANLTCQVQTANAKAKKLIAEVEGTP